MKKNNIKNRLIVFISCVALLFSLLSVNAFAADSDPPFSDFEYGNSEYTLPADELNYNTVYSIFSYYDILYSLNMTNGYRLVVAGFKPVSGGYYVQLYFSTGTADFQGNFGNADSVFVRYWRTSGSNRQFQIISKTGSVSSARIIIGDACEEGNIVVDSVLAPVNNFSVALNNYAYRTDNDEIVIVGSGISAEGATAPFIVSNIERILAFVATLGVPGDNVSINAYDLDIGSIFTAMMTAGMSIFNGFFGFTLFGINIAGTLVAILVVAIVIFIVKWLLGGK